MTTSQDSDGLSLEQLEALLRERRERQTVEQVRRMAGAERDLGPAAGRGPLPSGQLPRLPRSPRALSESHPSLRSLGYQELADAPAWERLKGRQKGRDIGLLILEILAVAALVAIVVYGGWRLRILNQESRRLQQAGLTPVVTTVETASGANATATPTASGTPRPTATMTVSRTPTTSPTETPSAQVVLPGGHDGPGPTPTPSVQATAGPMETVAPGPTATTEPALSPTPVDTATPANTATPTAIPADIDPKLPLRIEIEALGIDARVVEGDDTQSLKLGVGHRIGTANPGEPSNMVLSAHNDIYGEIFRDLHKLKPGDVVLVHTAAASYRYIVRSVEIVSPTRVEVMEPTEKAVLTMITCYPYLLDTHRVVAVADLAE